MFQVAQIELMRVNLELQQAPDKRKFEDMMTRIVR